MAGQENFLRYHCLNSLIIPLPLVTFRTNQDSKFFRFCQSEKLVLRRPNQELPDWPPHVIHCPEGASGAGSAEVSDSPSRVTRMRVSVASPSTGVGSSTAGAVSDSPVEGVGSSGTATGSVSGGAAMVSPPPASLSRSIVSSRTPVGPVAGSVASSAGTAGSSSSAFVLPSFWNDRARGARTSSVTEPERGMIRSRRLGSSSALPGVSQTPAERTTFSVS